MMRINPAQCQKVIGTGAGMAGARRARRAPEAPSMVTCDPLLGRSPLCHQSTSALAM